MRPEDVTVYDLTYTDAETKADKCVLTVDNWDLANFDNPLWKQGNRIRVSWGYPGRMAPTRECVIRKVTGFQKLKVEANGMSVVMNRITRSRTFENMTVSEIVTQVARENGYGADAIDIQETTERLPHVVQANMTDAQFLRRQAHQHNFEFFVDFDGFHFHERRLDQTAARTFTWYTDQDLCEIKQIQIKNDVTARPGRVRVRRRDQLGRTDADSTADNASDSNRSSTGTRIVMASAQEARLDGRVLVVNEQQTQGTGQQNPEEEARRRFRRAQQQAVEMTVTAIGDPNILAKSIVVIEGVGQRLSGNYYVKEITHKLSGGYEMTMTLIKDATGAYARRAARRGDGLPEVAATRTRANTPQDPEQEEQERQRREREAPRRMANAQSVTISGEATVPGDGGTRVRWVPDRGRDSRTGGGRPANPASTDAASRSVSDD